ncbi:hypothetical protein GCM10023157_04290 [Gluconacetobacter asukensis]
MYAYCYADRKIEFGKTIPNGDLPCGRGPARKLRDVVSVNARHAKDGISLLVPGIPEATNEFEAIEKLKWFRDLVEMRMSGQAGWPASRGDAP